MVATDSSPLLIGFAKGIPYKGQILNQIATKFMELTQVSGAQNAQRHH
jgi:phosphoribosylaminoimidazole-succinocarboxamide synthase